jgi:hypothetical protein
MPQKFSALLSTDLKRKGFECMYIAERTHKRRQKVHAATGQTTFPFADTAQTFSASTYKHKHAREANKSRFDPKRFDISSVEQNYLIKAAAAPAAGRKKAPHDQRRADMDGLD